MVKNLQKGDKVLFVSKPYDTNGCQWSESLNKYLGKILTIKHIDCIFCFKRYMVYEENEIYFLETDFVKKIEIGE